jgi:hypothetical protein
MMILRWIFGPLELYAFAWFVVWLGKNYSKAQLAKYEQERKRRRYKSNGRKENR